MQAFLYILKCANGQFYIASNKKKPDKKIGEHNLGQGANFSKKQLPVRLVYYEEFSKIGEAIKREKQLQRWSNKMIEALIKPKDQTSPE